LRQFTKPTGQAGLGLQGNQTRPEWITDRARRVMGQGRREGQTRSKADPFSQKKKEKNQQQIIWFGLRRRRRHYQRTSAGCSIWPSTQRPGWPPAEAREDPVGSIAGQMMGG